MDSSGKSSTTVIAGHQGIDAMTPTTQPKLTDGELIAVIDKALAHAEWNSPADFSDLYAARTAVAQIIAERDRLLGEVESRKEQTKADILTIFDLRKQLTAYTGTENQA